jgi:dTDP-N-acetylfucosamine:lipid II N-acetylfucosaminyltransferase
VVGEEPLAAAHSLLDLRLFASKKAIAKAVVAMAKAESNAQFVLHGQFNFPLWFAILFGQLPAERVYWHIWGADLYEDSRALKFRLFYPLRRLAQKRLKNVLGTYGDLAVFSKINAKADRLPIYFPTKMQNVAVSSLPKNEIPTILLGNSGDPSNRHLQALGQIQRAFGENVRIIVPMGYPENNDDYINQVHQTANALFSNGQVEILTEKIAFDRYLEILSECSLGWFEFERQQGVGTICLLIQQNIPLVLNRLNPFIQDLLRNDVPFLLSDEVSAEKMAAVQQDLQQLDKSQIAFFYPNYTQAWVALIRKMGEIK